MTRHPDLIYDVGLFDGGDSAYYLARGYRVVAIDANPSMVERARSRFKADVEAKRLNLLNVGIAKSPGTATFWVSDKPEWSSFNREIASRDDTHHRPVPVPVVPLSDLLSEYGIPHYLKIDIEGNDRLCVESLKGAELPQYVSVEAECVGDSDRLSDEEAVGTLESLREVGYRKFKLVSQEGWRPVRPRGAGRFFMRLVDSAAGGRLRVKGVSKIARRFTDYGRIAALGYRFAPDSTGPWGEDVPGKWMPFEKAKSVYLETRRSHFSDSEQPLYSFWYDWHATY
ncbi:MAG TPA: FkbM family methyltransferase [Verrucomicrobiae bacterium]|nr:FkbM family methyltransferase [Verrucomicrobiae bacterium]